jgi:hypothetical protein
MAKKKKREEKDTLEKVTKLKGAVDKIFRQTEKPRQEMDRYLREYRGRWWNEKDLADHPADSKVFVNYIFSTAMSIAPLLTDNRPVWSIRARKPFLQRMYDLYALCLEYLWDKIDMDQKTFKAVLDALVMKNGIFKVTFDPETPAPFGECRVDVVDPRDYFEAPGYDDNWENPFQGTRERKPLSWVRAKFPETGMEVKPDEDEPKTSARWDEREGYEVQSDFATIYEVWMRDDETEEYYLTEDQGDSGEKEKKREKGTRAKYPYGKIITFTKDTLLEEKPSKYRHNRPPYVKFFDYIVPHQSIGMGEADQIEQLNRSANRSLQLMDKFMAQYCDPNWLVNGQAGLDVKEVKTDLPGGGNVWDYNHGIDDNPIKRVDVGNLPADLYQYMAALPRIIEEVSGVTDITKGMSDKSERQTAAEVSTLIESSYTRTRQRVRNLEHALKRVCYLLVDLMQQFYTETRDFSIKTDQNIDYYKVSNQKTFMNQMMQPKPQEGKQPDPQEVEDWDQYKEFIAEFGEVDEVYAEFDLEIDTNSTLPMDKQSLANLALRLIQMKVIDPQAVLDILDFPNKEEIIQRGEERMQQAAAAKQGGGPQRPKMPPMPIQGRPPSPTQSRPEGI